MASISFKSVGVKQTSPSLFQKKSPRPIGIKTPLSIGVGDSGIFEMHYNFPEQIKDNLRNLLLTNHGDRLGRFDFGANLKELAFELTSKEDFDQYAMLNIKESVGKYMPFVELSEFESDFVDITSVDTADGLTTVSIKVTYSVPKLKIINDAIGVKLLVGG